MLHVDFAFQDKHFQSPELGSFKKTVSHEHIVWELPRVNKPLLSA